MKLVYKVQAARERIKMFAADSIKVFVNAAFDEIHLYVEDSHQKEGLAYACAYDEFNVEDAAFDIMQLIYDDANPVAEGWMYGNFSNMKDGRSHHQSDKAKGELILDSTCIYLPRPPRDYTELYDMLVQTPGEFDNALANEFADAFESQIDERMNERRYYRR